MTGVLKRELIWPHGENPAHSDEGREQGDAPRLRTPQTGSQPAQARRGRPNLPPRPQRADSGHLALTSSL